MVCWKCCRPYATCTDSLHGISGMLCVHGTKVGWAKGHTNEMMDAGENLRIIQRNQNDLTPPVGSNWPTLCV